MTGRPWLLLLCWAPVWAAPPQTASRIERGMAAARHSLERRDYRAAVAELGEVLHLDPRQEEARRLLERASLEQSWLVKLNLDEAAVRMKQQDYAGAAQLYQSALELDPGSQPARAGLRQAGYAGSYSSGVRAAQQGALADAARHFEECLALEPDDAAARRELDRMRSALAAVSQLREDLTAAIAALERGDRQGLDRSLRRSSALREAVGALPQSLGSAQEAAMLPIFAAYATGDVDRALRLADAASRSDAGALAGRFAEFLRQRRRMEYARKWLASGIAAYAVVLLAGVFFGLRQVRRSEPGEDP
jgi:tetratricopeptide (TPR) repeat protein